MVNKENEELRNGTWTTHKIAYISSPSGLTAMAVEENGTISMDYVNTDQLGSNNAVCNELSIPVTRTNRCGRGLEGESSTARLRAVSRGYAEPGRARGRPKKIFLFTFRVKS